MFKIAEELMKKIEAMVSTPSPAFAGMSMQMSSGCAQCSGSCAGNCNGECFGSCAGSCGSGLTSVRG